jgi:hypothetical protein
MLLVEQSARSSAEGRKERKGTSEWRARGVGIAHSTGDVTLFSDVNLWMAVRGIRATSRHSDQYETMFAKAGRANAAKKGTKARPRVYLAGSRAPGPGPTAMTNNSAPTRLKFFMKWMICGTNSAGAALQNA